MVPRGCAGVPQLTCSPEYIKHAHTHTHTQHTHTHTRTHAHTHARTHARTHAHTHTHSLRCVTDPGRIKRVIVARPGGQPSVASGRARAGRCPRARTGRPRRGATAVRPSSEGGTAGANRLGRHDRRSPPRRRLCSERMKRPRACPTHSSRAAAPPALVARAGSLAAAAERRRVYQFTRLARGTRALRGPAERHGLTSWCGHGNAAASGRVGGTHPGQSVAAGSSLRRGEA